MSLPFDEEDEDDLIFEIIPMRPSPMEDEEDDIARDDDNICPFCHEDYSWCQCGEDEFDDD